MTNGCQVDNKKDNSDSKKKAAITALIAAFFAMFLFMALCFVLRITPFGDKTFLYEDMKQQYVDFFAYYSNVFHGKDGFFYSANCGLGAKMLGIWAYYLTSPFLLMFVFVPDSYYPVAVTILIMLKIAAVAVTSSVFFSYISGTFSSGDFVIDIKKKSPSETCRQKDGRGLDAFCSGFGVPNIICSLAFAFSGWMIANMTNIMWLDAVIMMPLVLLGFFKMMRGEKRGRLVYILTVMIMVVMNYYIAAMVLMFVGVLAVVLVIEKHKDQDIKKFTEFVAATFCALLLDAWFLVPTAMSLMGSNKDHSGKMASAFAEYLPSSEAIGRYISPLSVIPKLFSMSYDSLEIMEGMPNIYFGAALIIPCILFFFNKRIDAGLKRLMGAYLFIVMLFFCVKPLNTLAHGGTEAYGYLYRYSFVFSFACVILAYLCLVNSDGIDLRGVLISGSLAIVLFAAAYLSKPGYMGTKAWIVNAGILCGVEALLIVQASAKKNTGLCTGTDENSKCTSVDDKPATLNGNVSSFANTRLGSNIVVTLLGLFLMCDIAMNFVCIYRNSSMNAESESGYMAKCEETRVALEDVRAELASDAISDNDGIDGNTLEANGNELEETDGMHEGGDNAEKGNPWYRIESVSPRTPNDSLHFGYPGTTTYNSLLKVENRVFMYRLGFNDNGLYTRYEEGNTRCADAILGIKYIINGVDYEKRDALSAEYTEGDKIPGLLEFIDDTKNPFEAQEMLWNKFTGKNDKVFVEADWIETSAVAKYGFNIADTYDDIESSDANNTYIYEIRPKISGKLYFYMNRDKNADRSLEIYVDGEFISGYGNASCQKVIDLGYYEEGDNPVLEIRAADGIEGLPDGMIVVTENEEVLRNNLMQAF